jgi:hypothetical protein
MRQDGQAVAERRKENLTLYIRSSTLRDRLNVSDSTYDYVYDFLHKVVCNLIFNQSFPISVDVQL